MKNITGRNLYTIIAFSMMLLLLAGCVTKKKKGDVSKAAKMWHNTNAHYNGWFNANELMVASEAKLIDQYSENYNEILPIYPSYKAPKPESVAQDLDKAIEKVSVVAVRHEVSQWVDDCYIILGKAQFLKQDYESAEETFAYFVEEFDPSYARRKKNKSNRNKKAKKKNSSKPKKVDKYGNERTNKKKKSKKSKVQRDKSGRKKVRKDPKTIEKPNETAEQKEERLAREKAAAEKLREDKAAKEKELENTVSNDNSSSGIFKHLSSFPEGLLWLAKTYVEREKYSLVDFYLNKIADQSEVSKEVLKEVPVVRAYNEMEQEHYAAAISHLEEAINLEKDKKTRARYIYILAQIQQELGNQKAAFAGFNKVIDMKPDFLMEFNAALNMLKSSMGEGESSLATAESKLNKMLEEDKFLNFRDQIYFTLGEIRFSRNEIDEAIPNFRKSIKFNTGNTTQLVESYYILANIFYDKEDYVMSKNYYDSTSTVINKKDDRYFEVQAFATNLKGIAENINTIELQDSLIALANKTPEERAEIAAQIKKEQLLAEAAAEAASQAEQGIDLAPGSIRQVQGRSISPGSRTSTWFAYDPNKVRIGKDDFKRDWGFRNLEDDWRRSEKSSGVNTASSFDEDDEVYLTEEEINEIMKDVPLTADAMTQAKLKIREALYELGVQYRDKIQNYNKAIEAHESLQSRFPGSEKEPDALYYLYLSHNDVSQPDRANYYLNQLKSKYPEEKYTLALTDPNYVENFLQESKIQERLYNQAYSKFQSGEFTEVLSMEKSANEKFDKNNTFASKYALLSAMAIGNLEGKEKYIAALKNMIATYPNTDEQTRAREILRFLNGDEEAFAEIDKGEAIQEFTEDNDKLHYIIVVVNAKKDSDINAAKISVSNYNRKYHKTERIKTSSSTLNKDNNTQLVLLRKFSGKEDAMKYYNEVDRNKKEFMEPKVNFQVFAITQKNFREIMKKKSIKEYEVFFNERYLEQAE